MAGFAGPLTVARLFLTVPLSLVVLFERGDFGMGELW
jgi:hypothetical protein